MLRAGEEGLQGGGYVDSSERKGKSSGAISAGSRQSDLGYRPRGRDSAIAQSL